MDPETGIRNRVEQLSPLSDEAWEDFSALFEEVQLEKHALLVSEGQHAHHCYYLSEGVIRVFYTHDGNEYNKTFFVAGMFPTPLTALLSSSPSRLGFQALTPCRLIKFSYPGFRNLFQEHRCLESLMLAILEHEWMKKEVHNIRMVTNHATENYLLFREEYPGLENAIPQYHISSYLGITPIQLSRIRARLAKG